MVQKHLDMPCSWDAVDFLHVALAVISYDMAVGAVGHVLAAVGFLHVALAVISYDMAVGHVLAAVGFLHLALAAVGHVLAANFISKYLNCMQNANPCAEAQQMEPYFPPTHAVCR